MRLRLIGGLGKGHALIGSGNLRVDVTQLAQTNRPAAPPGISLEPVHLPWALVAIF